MSNNHRIVTSGDDWMRDQERRLTRQERRPNPANLNARFGPAISQRAMKVADWNDVEILRNGWFSSESFSINSPDPDTGWMGTCIVRPDGTGIQELWSHGEPLTRGFVREITWPSVDLLPTFSEWSLFTIDDTDWITPTLSGTWTHFDTIALPVQYRRLNGFTCFRGLLGGGTADTTAFILPPEFCGFWPRGNAHFPIVASAGFGFVRVDNDGHVKPAQAGTYNDIGPITFPAVA